MDAEKTFYLSKSILRFSMYPKEIIMKEAVKYLKE